MLRMMGLAATRRLWFRNSRQSWMMLPGYKWTQSGPARRMAEAHQRKLELCVIFEEMADALPEGLDRLTCLNLAGELIPQLRLFHEFEEETVYPLFRMLSHCDAASDSTIRRLKAEHIEDQAYADEICEILILFGDGQPIRNPEAFGFMLRGFFTTLRRHVAFEQTHVLEFIIRSTERHSDLT